MIHFLHLFGALLAIVVTPPPPIGFRGWGAGPGPTGLRDSPGVAHKQGVMHTTTNQSFYVILAVTGKPQQAPPMYVPPGAQVSVRAHNGLDGGNQHVVRLAHQPELLGAIEGDPITPDSDISWPCNTTGDIWVVGTAGDGIRVSVQAQRV